MVELHRPHATRRSSAYPSSLGATGTERFPPVVSRDEQVMEAPPMPTVPLKPPAPPRRRVEAAVNPVDALREIGFLLERSRADTHRVKAYRGPPTSSPRSSEDERAEHTEARRAGRRSPASDRRPPW